MSVENVKVIGEEGEVKLLGENSPKDQFSLANWITFSNKSMRMKPKETNTVNFRIAIPKDIEPGGKYASIVISMDRINRAPKESGASVKVVSLVMVSVSGDIREEAVIESFSPINNLVDGFVDFDLRMKNKGNSHIRPEGTIVITNFWGKKVGEVALESENVLPSATRKMMTRWQPNKLLIGRYTATLVSSYGEKHNTPISATTAFFARTDLILLMALMIGAAFFSPLLVFRRKRKNSKVTGIMSLFRKTSAGSQADK
ncbi:MAG: hypothetical protein BWY68_00666 [bacterium ADurb.Bin400]|nr:MAG: hypothetical protein BWY68_00666 [bacterium ADurb.Bin400]